MLPVIHIIAAFFIVIGICQVVLQLTRLIRSNKPANERKLLVFIDRENEKSAEFLIRNALEVADKCDVYVINQSISEEVRRICGIISRQEKNVVIFSSADKGRFLERMLEEEKAQKEEECFT